MTNAAVVEQAGLVVERTAKIMRGLFNCDVELPAQILEVFGNSIKTLLD